MMNTFWMFARIWRIGAKSFCSFWWEAWVEEIRKVMKIILKVWLHPLRRDSESYTDALFFQRMPNYLAVLYTTLREDGTATAATLVQFNFIYFLYLILEWCCHFGCSFAAEWSIPAAKQCRFNFTVNNFNCSSNSLFPAQIWQTVLCQKPFFNLPASLPNNGPSEFVRKWRNWHNPLVRQLPPDNAF